MRQAKTAGDSIRKSASWTQSTFRSSVDVPAVSPTTGSAKLCCAHVRSRLDMHGANPARFRQKDELTRVVRIPSADDDQDIDATQHVQDGLLALPGRQADRVGEDRVARRIQRCDPMRTASAVAGGVVLWHTIPSAGSSQLATSSGDSTTANRSRSPVMPCTSNMAFSSDHDDEAASLRKRSPRRGHAARADTSCR